MVRDWLSLCTADATKIIANNAWISGAVALLIMIFELVYGAHELTKYGMTLLLLLIFIDWVSGFSAAKKDLIDTSSYGIEGLMRTSVLLTLPAIAHFVDLFFMTQGLASYFMIAALARHLTKSASANIIRVGWTKWIPAKALNSLVKWAANEIASKDARAQKRFDSIYKEDDE